MKRKISSLFVVGLMILSGIPFVNAAATQDATSEENAVSQTLRDYTVYHPPYDGTEELCSYLGNPWADTNLTTGGVATIANTTGEIDDVSCSASAFQRLDLYVGRSKKLTIEVTIWDYLMGVENSDWGKYGWNAIWRYREFDALHEGKYIIGDVFDTGTEWLASLDDIVEWLSYLGYAVKPTSPKGILSILLTLALLSKYANAPQYHIFDIKFDFIADGGKRTLSG